MNFAKLSASALSLSLLVTACHKNPAYTTKIPQSGTGMAGDVGAGNSITNPPPYGDQNGVPMANPGDFANFTPDPKFFEADTVHFAFDSAVVRPDEKSKVSAVADYLKSNSGDALRIEGHCDERGTEEYNRALGERRALALREELIRDGADGQKILTISYGKDRPVDSGHDEAAWSQNRRGVFVLLTPPKTQ